MAYKVFLDKEVIYKLDQIDKYCINHYNNYSYIVDDYNSVIVIYRLMKFYERY